MGSGAKRLDRFRPPGPSGNFNLESGLARLNRGATGCSSRVHLGSAHTHSSLVSGGSSANVTGAAIRRAKGAHRTNILNVHFGSLANLGGCVAIAFNRALSRQPRASANRTAETRRISSSSTSGGKFSLKANSATKARAGISEEILPTGPRGACSLRRLHA